MNFDIKSANKEQKIKENKNKQRKFTVAVMGVALISALLLWFYVLEFDSPNFQKKFTSVQVTVSGVSELKEKQGYSILSEFNLAVDITVSGKKTEVNRLSGSDIKAYIDVSKQTASGSVFFNINCTLPNGIKLEHMSTETVNIYIDKNITAEIPVAVILDEYVLGSNMVLGAPVVNPVSVTVEGAEREIMRIEKAVANLNLGNITGSMSAAGNVKLYFEDDIEVNTSFIRLIDTVVNVEIPVYIQKNVPLKVYFTGGMFSTSQATMSLSVEEILCKGTIEQMMNFNEIKVMVDETKLGREGQAYSYIVLPEGIENLSSNNEVLISYKFMDISNRTFSILGEDIAIRGITGNETITVKDEIVNITFAGLIDALRYLEPTDFNLTIDVSSLTLESGNEYLVPVSINFSQRYSAVYVFGSYAVTIIVD